MTRPDDIISASEIGQWTYCHRAWHLARTGAVNRNVAALAQGEAGHQRHSREVARTQALRWLAIAFVALAILILLAVVAFGLLR